MVVSREIISYKSSSEKDEKQTQISLQCRIREESNSIKVIFYLSDLIIHNYIKIIKKIFECMMKLKHYRNYVREYK